jgi:hypothetical protein
MLHSNYKDQSVYAVKKIITLLSEIQTKHTFVHIWGQSAEFPNDKASVMNDNHCALQC